MVAVEFNSSQRTDCHTQSGEIGRVFITREQRKNKLEGTQSVGCTGIALYK